MNTFIPLETLSETDLHDFHEVWITSEISYPQDPSHAHSVCLWRTDRVLTRDVAIDNDYFQDLPCLWLRVDDVHDQAAVDRVKQAVTARLQEQQLHGEFFPQELPGTEEGSSDARDLRS
jgi:hypothetical protein